MNEKILNEVYDDLWKIFEQAKNKGKTGVIISLEILYKIINKFDEGMER